MAQDDDTEVRRAGGFLGWEGQVKPDQHKPGGGVASRDNLYSFPSTIVFIIDELFFFFLFFPSFSFVIINGRWKRGLTSSEIIKNRLLMLGTN